MDLCGVSRARGVRWFLEWLDSPSDDLMSRTNEPMVYRLCSQCHVGLVQLVSAAASMPGRPHALNKARHHPTHLRGGRGGSGGS